MKKISEYRQHAEECRMLARRAGSEEHRDLLLNMSATWDSLADDRERLVLKAPAAGTQTDTGGQTGGVGSVRPDSGQ